MEAYKLGTIVNYTHLKERLAPSLVFGLTTYVTVRTATHYGYTFESWAESLALALVIGLVGGIAVTILKIMSSK